MGVWRCAAFGGCEGCVGGKTGLLLKRKKTDVE